MAERGEIDAAIIMGGNLWGAAAWSRFSIRLGYYKFPGRRTRADSFSDHCRRIEVDYQIGSKQQRPKDSVVLCADFS